MNVFDSVELRPEVFDAVQLPFHIVRGVIGTFEAVVPLNLQNLQNPKVVLRIDKLFILAR